MCRIVASFSAIRHSAAGNLKRSARSSTPRRSIHPVCGGIGVNDVAGGWGVPREELAEFVGTQLREDVEMANHLLHAHLPRDVELLGGVLPLQGVNLGDGA